MKGETTTTEDRARLLECAATAARRVSPRPWEVTLESRQFGVHADVLCRRDAASGSVYVAMNFVTESVDATELRLRHDALEAAAVRTAWFVLAQPGKEFADSRAAVFTARGSRRTAGELPEWSAAGVTLATEGAVEALLTGQFRLLDHLLLSGPYYVRLEPVWRACWNCETTYIGVTPTVLRADDHGELRNPTCSTDPRSATEERSVIGQLVARTLACDPWKTGPVCSWRADRDSGSPDATWKGLCPKCDAPGRDGPKRRAGEALHTAGRLHAVTYSIKASPRVVGFSHWCYAPGTSHGSHCPNPSLESTDVLSTHAAPTLVATSFRGAQRREGLNRDLTETITASRAVEPERQSIARLT